MKEIIKLDDKTIDGVNFKDAALDTDYFGWNYEIPDTNEKVVVLNNFYSKFEHLDGSQVDEYYENLKLFISNWNKFSNFHDPDFSYGYYVLLLVFDSNVDDETIIRTAIKYAQEIIYKNYKDPILYLKYREYLLKEIEGTFENIVIRIENRLNDKIL